ncbi:MAG: TauD/TfdA family dioxygenase [Alphaproteobacteria bacterium]|nr:TauD/TfdA family dioxygenase [Alphaproteobacteria bacterium]
MKDSRRWVRDLSPEAIAALDRALGAVRQLDWWQIARENFPLQGFDALLADIRNELERGCGIVKLRGFPVGRYDEADLRRLYFGLGCHLGTPVFQNRKGELMRAIRDEGAHVGRTYGQLDRPGAGKAFLSSYARTLSNAGLRFHTDRTDVVGLLCVRQARAGGVSKLVSTPAIHNALLARRPDLLETLFGVYWRSRFGEEGTDRQAVYELPIFGRSGQHFTSHYSLTFIEAAQLNERVPKLTERQREAIDLLMAIAEELCFEMVLEPGDLQLINSHVTYHGRSAFEDDAAIGQDRLLLRLWLTMPDNRPLPEDHRVLWRAVEPGRPRGGIGQTAM